MATKPKNLLLILELNQTLAFIKNNKSKLKDFSTDAYQITYDAEIDNFSVLWRSGRPEFLEYLFNIDKDKIDVGVWTNLDAKLGQLVTQKYFGRYYRELLFVLPTNRGLYNRANTQPQDPMKVPKQLTGLFNQFPQYNVTNTLVLTCQPNALQQYSRNDTFVPPFSAKNSTFQQDVGCIAITKYLKGMLLRLRDQTLTDVRNMNTGKPLDNLYRRLSHRSFSDIKYN